MELIEIMELMELTTTTTTAWGQIHCRRHSNTGEGTGTNDRVTRTLKEVQEHCRRD